MVDLPGSAGVPLSSRAASEALEAVSMSVERDQVVPLSEVKLLAEYIDRIRRDIMALGGNSILKSHVLTATNQLDAIVINTAEATSTILDVCETLESTPVLAAHAAIGAATARIYEACSFQDITGQRVAKVVATLQEIESKIAEILNTFGDGLSAPPHPRPQRPANTLLNGPQQPGIGMDQSAVDALLDNKA